MAGGLGGSTGDMLMHSLDTVKTRQQGAPAAIKYATTPKAYATILREEGFARGLYSGVTPAFLGSFPGTIIFFGTYEYSKRYLLDRGVNPTLSYLTAGFLGDLFMSVVYVPSEVLKTRLQLQGRWNNPYFHSGYNYRGTVDAARTIVRREGFQALFHGYKATLQRDLPFSALQFAFYEYFQKVAYKTLTPGGKRIGGGHGGEMGDIGVAAEIATGGLAGGLAGVITCPLDVVKTRLQTQVRTSDTPPVTAKVVESKVDGKGHGLRGFHTTAEKPVVTSSPSTAKPAINAVGLHTNSTLKGLVMIYRGEGFRGLFSGVVPRAVWTSVQSGVMLLLYQTLLKEMAKMSRKREEEMV